MIDDLGKNLLEDNLDKLPGDKTQKVAKAALSGYGKTQKVLFYLLIAKWSAVIVIGSVLIWGGYSLVMGAKDMVTGMVIDETKEVVAEKYNGAKTKAADVIATQKAKVAEKTEGKSFLSGLVAAKEQFDTKLDAAAAEAMVEKGLAPDAPKSCLFGGDANICDRFSSKEISGDDYDWIKMSWKDDECGSVYGKAMDRLRENGKVTMNDYRTLQQECVDIREDSGNAAREERKRKMLEEL